MKLVNMHIYLCDYQEETYNAFKDACNAFIQYGVKEISVSPMRDYGEFGELYVTLQLDESYLTALLDFISDGWEGPEDDCMAVAFTSNRMFHETINTIYFTMYD